MQSKSDGSTAVDAAVEAVAVAAERLRISMLTPQVDALNALTSEFLTYGHSNGRLDSKSDFIGDLLSRRSCFITIDISAQTIVVSGDTALLRHSLSAKTADDGRPGNVHLFVLQVWQHDGAAWRLLARQAVRQPQQA